MTEKGKEIYKTANIVFNFISKNINDLIIIKDTKNFSNGGILKMSNNSMWFYEQNNNLDTKTKQQKMHCKVWFIYRLCCAKHIPVCLFVLM